MWVTMILVWLRFVKPTPSFPPQSGLGGYWKYIGKIQKKDLDRMTKGIFTFSRICVHIKLIKGIPYHILLKHETFHSKQVLHYENMALRC